MSKKSMFKVTILGDPGVGKTSLRKKYMGRGFSTSYLPTMGCDFAVHNINRDDMEIEFQLWDLAGQASFELLIPRFIANSNGTIIVFDLTRRKTFVDLSKWLKKFIEINENLSGIPIYIVGNKADLEDFQVEEDEIHQYRKYVKSKLGLENAHVKSFITSAKSGQNVDEMFENMIDVLVDDIKS